MVCLAFLWHRLLRSLSHLDPQTPTPPHTAAAAATKISLAAAAAAVIANLLVLLPLSSQIPGGDNSADWHIDRRCLPNHLEGQFGGKMRLEEEQIWLP